MKTAMTLYTGAHQRGTASNSNRSCSLGPAVHQRKQHSNIKPFITHNMTT